MPDIVEQLVELGITSVSANTDAVATVREVVARVEKKLVLKARENSCKNKLGINQE